MIDSSKVKMLDELRARGYGNTAQEIKENFALALMYDSSQKKYILPSVSQDNSSENN